MTADRRASDPSKCTNCGGNLSRKDIAEGITYHCSDPGGPPTCKGKPLVFRPKTVTLDEETIAYLETLGPSLSAGVREAVRRLRAGQGPAPQ